MELINEAKTKVFEEFGIFLECEVEILEKEQL
jgi:UDP-N-acetylenolpyruvoylglucosamine reductase